MQLGEHSLPNTVFLAPMAGITDRPFRTLARRFGAGLAVSEMVSSRPELRASRKSLLRVDHAGEPGPVSVQIVGADPATMAEAARANVDRGAQLIDINMGCPAKKVCNVAAGSALLSDEPLVARILESVVAAVSVPVTLKIRTGPSPDARNALRIARIAQASGIRLLSIHGRTRACAFRGEAEYDTIAAVKAATALPVIANGDIRSGADAREVLRRTGADGVMIGRAAQGQPWIFRELVAFLAGGRVPEPLPLAARHDAALEHLEGLYALYGEEQGARIARKHLGWYAERAGAGLALHGRAVRTSCAREQRASLRDIFSGAAGRTMADERLAA